MRAGPFRSKCGEAGTSHALLPLRPPNQGESVGWVGGRGEGREGGREWGGEEVMSKRLRQLEAP